MKKQRLSKLEKIKIFLNEYYLGYGIVFSTLRIIGGPLIIIFGLNQYLNGETKPEAGYSGFMMFFGIYYLLKPLITIMFHKEWFENFDLDYEIKPEKIIIRSNKSMSELDFSEIKTILKRKTYFKIKINSKKGIYLPIKLLELTEIDILKKQKNTLNNK